MEFCVLVYANVVKRINSTWWWDSTTLGNWKYFFVVYNINLSAVRCGVVYLTFWQCHTFSKGALYFRQVTVDWDSASRKKRSILQDTTSQKWRTSGLGNGPGLTKLIRDIHPFARYRVQFGNFSYALFLRPYLNENRYFNKNFLRALEIMLVYNNHRPLNLITASILSLNPSLIIFKVFLL